MLLNKQQRADEIIQATSSSALCGLDLGNRSTGPIWPHLLVYLLWQLGNQKWAFTLSLYTKCFLSSLCQNAFLHSIFFSSLSQVLLSLVSGYQMEVFHRDWFSAWSQSSEGDNVVCSCLSSEGEIHTKYSETAYSGQAIRVSIDASTVLWKESVVNIHLK